MTSKANLLKKYPQEFEWHTDEVLLWLNNDEGLYFGAKKIKNARQMECFWRNNKPSGAKTNSRYVNWQEVFKQFNEE